MNELDCFRRKTLERELWFARGQAGGLRLLVGIGVFDLTQRLGRTVLAGGAPALIVPFLLPGLAVLALFLLHRARFLDRLVVRAEARLNQLAQADLIEAGTLTERSFAWNRGVVRTEFDSRRGAWLSAAVMAAVGFGWLGLIFLGCQEAIRWLRPTPFALGLWLVAFVAWMVGAGQLIWHHLRVPAELPAPLAPLPPTV